MVFFGGEDHGLIYEVSFVFDQEVYVTSPHRGHRPTALLWVSSFCCHCACLGMSVLMAEVSFPPVQPYSALPTLVHVTCGGGAAAKSIC